MRGKKWLVILTAGVLGLALAAGAGAQAPAAKPGPASQVRPQLQQITVQGKIKYLKIMGGYYILSKPETFKIFNPNPQVLDALVKSGKTLVIVAKPHGDILEIMSIDGQPYQGSRKPKVK